MTQLSTLFHSGGIMMYPLFICAVLALAVIFERFWTLTSITRAGKQINRQIAGYVSGGRWDEMQKWLSTLEGPIADTLAAGLTDREKGIEAMELAMEDAAREAFPSLRHRLPVLDTIITAAPLLGLLGTITGLMGVFRVVADKLAHNPHADTSGITGGIAESLIATATGISIAVVALIFYNLFNSMNEQIITETERQATHLVHLISHGTGKISGILEESKFTEEKGTVR